MKQKISITLENLFNGEEPTFGNPKTELGIARSLSWYANQFGPKESKKYTLDYLKEKKYSKEIVSKISSASEELFKNLGFVCRMIMRGADLDKHSWIEQRINEIISFDPEAQVQSSVVASTQQTVQSSKPEKTIQDKMFEQATQYINDIEGHIDDFIKKRTSKFKCYEYLSANSIKPAYIPQIKEHYKPLVEELNLAYDKKDEQLVESYSHWSKKELKNFVDFVTGIINDCENYVGNAKTVRAPRKKKAIPLEKKVASVKYQKESVEFKIASISPTEILGATQLWVFNTKYKQLGLYKSEDESGFGIKGTTLIGFDENNSVGKTLRKPSETLEAFKKAKKPELKKLLSTLSTKESKLNGRINSDTIILKAIK